MLNNINDMLLKMKVLREKKGLTQGQIAEKIGVKASQYSYYERGQSKITLEKFLEVLKILDIEVQDFFEFESIDKEQIAEVYQTLGKFLQKGEDSTERIA